jgi:hypothetical protein
MGLRPTGKPHYCGLQVAASNLRRLLRCGWRLEGFSGIDALPLSSLLAALVGLVS